MNMRRSITSQLRTEKTLAASRQWYPTLRRAWHIAIRRCRRGFTLVEAVISIVLVGMTLVTAMSLAGLSGAGQTGAFQQRRGHMLARELLIEIQSQSYVDPDLLEAYWDSIVRTGSITLSGGDNFGPAAGEVTGNRSLFDDVDDYNGWTASPPQDKDGAVRSDFAGWTRTAVVEKVNPGDFSLLPSTDHGLRRIIVSASYKGSVVARVTGFKSAGLPPLEACCECNEPCADLPVSICELRGGTPQGFGTSCAVDACVRAKVALVVNDVTSLDAIESDRIAMLESMDFVVTTIDDDDTQANYDALAATVDLFYISDIADKNKYDTKLNNVTVGVLTENKDHFVILGFSSNHATKKHADIDIVDTTHYITATFSTGVLQIMSPQQDFHLLKDTLGGGVSILAYRTGDPTLVALAAIDVGGALYGGGIAAGRRVKLPWSDRTAFTTLTPDGLTILERSVLWAAGCALTAVCGDGDCELGESSCSCAADCGAPTAIETILVNCNDGLDNDCDGNTDCDDVNCAQDGTCFLPSCGNLICEAGEDCHNCNDCPGESIGGPLLEYCCGDGVASTKEVNLGLCNGNY